MVVDLFFIQGSTMVAHCLPNLGERSWQMLAAAGIHSVAQLRKFGPVLAWVAVQQAGQKPTRNLLWAIAAGLQNRDWRDLSNSERTALEMELDQLLNDSGINAP
jgi:DNA transformation protein and related proteins